VLFSPQIPLRLEPQRADRFVDFVPGPNQAALMAVENLLVEPGSGLFLSGPRGSGKSHLLNALCNEAREMGMGAFYIALKQLPQEAASGLEGLQGLDLVCVDDLHCVVGDRVWENALFNCFNEIHAARGRLAVSSRQALSSLTFVLPDLESRLAWGLRVNLQAADDEGKLQVLKQRSQVLGIELQQDVQRYLIRHSQRDMGSLLLTLDRLKEAAYVTKRRITVPLAREVLASEK
jgi:DnaA family protein